MKTRLHLFIIACVALLSFQPIHAMEQPNTSTHRLVGILRKEWITGTVTCVKKISEQYVVVFNKDGIGLLFEDNGKVIKQWEVKGKGTGHIPCLKNIFTYQDQGDGQLLLIAYDNQTIDSKGLYVCRLDPAYEVCRPVLIKHTFKVVQVMVAFERILVIINTKDNSAFPIDLTWTAVDKEYLPPLYTDLFPIKPLDAFSLDDVIYEGLVVDAQTYQDDWKQFLLPKEMFDVQLLSEEEKEWMLMTATDLRNNQSIKIFKEISCYHKTSNGTIFAGHDDGSVSVWEPK